MRRDLLAIAALACGPASLTAQAVLAGFVRADSTELPIAGVEVLIEGLGRSALTDARGKFVLSGLPLGARTAVFRSVGWRPVRLRVNLVEGDTVWTEAAMIKELVQLTPIVVSEAKPAYGMREEFEARRRMGFGRFLDSTLLRSSEHLRFTDLLRRVDGIVLQRSGTGVFAMSIRRPGCFMQVILDGHVLYRSFAPTSRTDTIANPPPNFAREFDIPALEAVEVYRSAAETPSEFGGPGAACGTIVLWSRLGRD